MALAWRLRGRLNAPAGTAPGGARLLATAIAKEEVAAKAEGAAGEDGTVDLDVTALFAGKAEVRELEVSADHPSFLLAKTRVVVPPPGSRGEGPEVVLPLEMSLVPAAALRGRVTDEAGAPVPGAIVAGFALLAEGPDASPTDTTTTGAEGNYRLRLREGGRFLVAAAAEGRRPGALKIAGGEPSAPDIVLSPGAAIEGRVLDTAGNPLAGAVVEAWVRESPGGSRVRLAGRDFAWGGERLAPSAPEVVTGEDGRFRLGGLDEGEHSVGVEDLAGEFALLDAFEGLERTVRAPAAGVDFRVPIARLRLRILVDGQPLPNADVGIMGKGRHMFSMNVSADADGRVSLVARPGGSYEVRVSDGNQVLGPQTVEVPSGFVGDREESLEFRRPPPRGALVVVLNAPGGPPVTRAGFGLYPPGARDRPFPYDTRDLSGEGGRFRVADVDAGKYRLVVRAGGDWYGGAGHFLEEEAEVDIPSEGENEVRLALRPGGRLRIAAKNAEGQHLAAKCSVEDSSGKKLPAWFSLRGPVGGFIASTGRLIVGGPNNVDPVLIPGRYTVRLSLDGYLERVVEATVELGKTTEVEATLERR